MYYWKNVSRKSQLMKKIKEIIRVVRKVLGGGGQKKVFRVVR